MSRTTTTPGSITTAKRAAVRRQRAVDGLLRHGVQHPALRHVPQLAVRSAGWRRPATGRPRSSRRAVPAAVARRAGPARAGWARPTAAACRPGPPVAATPAVGAHRDRGHEPVVGGGHRAAERAPTRWPAARCAPRRSARPARRRAPSSAARRGSDVPAGPDRRPAGATGSAAGRRTAWLRAASVATTTAPTATSSSTLSAATSARSRGCGGGRPAAAARSAASERSRNSLLGRVQPDPVARRLQPGVQRGQPGAAVQVVVLPAGRVPGPRRLVSRGAGRARPGPPRSSRAAAATRSAAPRGRSGRRRRRR